MVQTFFFMMIVAAFTFCLSNGQADQCRGIEKYIFGTPKDQYKNMTLEFEQGNAALYTVNKSDIKIQGVEIESLRISFIKNKLSAIAIATKNHTGAAFYKYLKDRYGLPLQLKSRYEWKGEQVTITLELFKNKDAAVDFYCR